MIEKGADLKVTDAGGSTTLMWAATDEATDPAIVEELLKRGVDPNAANKNGDTALSWGLRRGYTPIVEALKKHGASDPGMVKRSIEQAIALLQKSGPEFVKVSGCTSCHHQSLPQMAYAAARERGFAVDPQISQQQVKAVTAMFRPMREQMLAGKENIPDPPISGSYSLLGLAPERYAPDAITEAMAHLISTQQAADGSFRVLSARPPIESSVFAGTALSLRALQVYGHNAQDKIVHAGEWLRTAAPVTVEDRAMQLLGLGWGQANRKDLEHAARALH